MSRPRKPTALLKLEGAFKNHPKREKEREHEPQVVEPLGDPPDSLDEAEQARWNEIAAMAPWATYADRIIVEELARLWMMSRRRTATPAHGKRLDWCLSRLGLTPSDRSKVKAPPKREEQNPYAELA